LIARDSLKLVVCAIISGNFEGDDGHLHGFSTDEDSSDEESDSGIRHGKITHIAKDNETVKRKLDKAKQQPVCRFFSLVIFSSSLHNRRKIVVSSSSDGFHTVSSKTNSKPTSPNSERSLVYDSRGIKDRFLTSEESPPYPSSSTQTGKSKHYAFVEFDSSAVAKIITETMDNYLIMGHILQCKVIPKDKVHPELWVGANRKWRVVPRDRIARVQHNKVKIDN
jgi:nucleolar protein 15